MKKFQILTLLLSLALMFSLVPTAFAKGDLTLATNSTGFPKASSNNVNLTINNKSGGVMYISLTSPSASYFFVAAIGSTKVHVKFGNYTYRVISVCGDLTGKLKVEKITSWKWTCTKPKSK